MHLGLPAAFAARGLEAVHGPVVILLRRLHPVATEVEALLRSLDLALTPDGRQVDLAIRDHRRRPAEARNVGHPDDVLGLTPGHRQPLVVRRRRHGIGAAEGSPIRTGEDRCRGPGGRDQKDGEAGPRPDCARTETRDENTALHHVGSLQFATSSRRDPIRKPQLRGRPANDLAECPSLELEQALFGVEATLRIR